MPLAVTQRYGSGAPNTSSLTTPSLSLSTDALELCWVASQVSGGTPNTPTVSGASRTWTQVATILTNNWRTTLFRSLAAASSGAITIDFAAQTQTNAKYSFTKWDGVDTSGTNGAGAVVQSATANNGDTSNTGVTVTLAAFGSANNAAHAFNANSTGAAVTVGSGFTFLLNDTGLFTDTEEWKLNDTTADFTWSSQTVTSNAIAIEVKEAVVTTLVKDIIQSGILPFAR